MRGLAAVADDGSYVLQAGDHALSSPNGRGTSDAHARLTLQGAAPRGGLGEQPQQDLVQVGGVLRVDSFLPDARARVAASGMSM
jgi:hypothetical protein